MCEENSSDIDECLLSARWEKTNSTPLYTPFCGLKYHIYDLEMCALFFLASHSLRMFKINSQEKRTHRVYGKEPASVQMSPACLLACCGRDVIYSTRLNSVMSSEALGTEKKIKESTKVTHMRASFWLRIFRGGSKKWSKSTMECV